jgi:hypothetical protein
MEMIEMPLEDLASLTDNEYRNLFTKGRKFKVLEPSLLTGTKPIAPYTEQGWRRELKPGDIITCEGTSNTFGDGVPAVKWTDENGKWLANDCTFLYTQVHGDAMWGGQCPSRGRVVPLYSETEGLPLLASAAKKEAEAV